MYDQQIRHLRAEAEQLRAEKMEDAKIINSQATELLQRRAEVFQLRQELQLLRDEVAQHSKRNFVSLHGHVISSMFEYTCSGNN